MMEQSSSSAPVLILHVDINKTLLIQDPVSNVETDHMINSLLSECSWGIVNAPRSPSELTLKSWRLVHHHPSSSFPAVDLPESSTSIMMTYNEFLENMLKPDRPTKKRLKAVFTQPGELGEALRPYFHLASKALQISSTMREKLEEPGHDHNNHDPDLLSKFRSSKQYYILPSFFRFINHLEEEGRAFHLIFRTFGVDIPGVAKEWNAFCQNQHPLFTPTRPEQTKHRCIVLPRDSCAIYRTDSDVNQGIHLAAVSSTQLVTVTHGLKDVYERIIGKLEEGEGRRTLALQDDYQWWAKNQESTYSNLSTDASNSDDSGKILIIESSSSSSSSSERQHHHHIFFDDNIERDRPHIVDARDLATGNPLPFHQYTRGRHLIKVEPLEAILDEYYFIKALNLALQATKQKSTVSI